MQKKVETDTKTDYLMSPNKLGLWPEDAFNSRTLKLNIHAPALKKSMDQSWS